VADEVHARFARELGAERCDAVGELSDTRTGWIGQRRRVHAAMPFDGAAKGTKDARAREEAVKDDHDVFTISAAKRDHRRTDVVTDQERLSREGERFTARCSERP
jgi:hypothetical protein